MGTPTARNWQKYWQWSTRQVFIVITLIGAAMAIVLHPSRTGWTLVPPLLSMYLLVVTIRSRRADLRVLAASYGSFCLLVSLIVLELASGYGWRVPVVGVMPGPPNHEVQLAFRIATAGMMCAAIAILLRAMRTVPLWSLILAAVPWMLLALFYGYVIVSAL